MSILRIFTNLRDRTCKKRASSKIGEALRMYSEQSGAVSGKSMFAKSRFNMGIAPYLPEIYPYQRILPISSPSQNPHKLLLRRSHRLSPAKVCSYLKEIPSLPAIVSQLPLVLTLYNIQPQKRRRIKTVFKCCESCAAFQLGIEVCQRG